ncbi:MAG: hypothetical protein JRN20_11985 [Nitrososphaerota archaeon]|nr:hypothetical protein [Nitrososphaerota archaeon]
MSYSSDKPFKNREHIIWEIGYCNKAANYITFLSLAFAALGVIGDLLNMKLALGATSWFLLAIFAGVLAIVPNLHAIMAKHLLGMEVSQKRQTVITE